MNRRCKRLLAGLCTFLLAFSLLTGIATAAGEGDKTEAYTQIPLYVEGIRASGGNALMVNNITYVSVRFFCQAIAPEMTVTWDDASQTAVAEMTGLQITAQVGLPYIEVNDRYFWEPSGVIMCDGAVCVPLDALAKAFTVDVTRNDQYQTIDIGLDNMAPAAPADQYYNSDDLYWLSRVISAEAGNQPLIGMIGVGDVVINRVNTPRFNVSTIKEAIFAPGQFSTVPTGAIYMTPNANSILAAKLCLDGANTVGGALYFVNPTTGDTSWLDPSTLIVAIGQHNFYA